jgi:hypothetical protein
LERGRVWNGQELGGGRLAVPRVGCGDGGGAAGVTVRGGGAGVAGATGVAEDDFAAETPIVGGTNATTDAEYVAKMEEEQNILSK